MTYLKSGTRKLKKITKVTEHDNLSSNFFRIGAGLN